MKVTIVTGPFFPCPPGPAGAVERLWADIGAEFCSLGHEVKIVCKELSDNAQYVSTNLSYQTLKGFDRTGRLVFDLIRDFKYSRKALRMIGEPDVAVHNAFWLPVLVRFNRALSGKVLQTYNLARFPKNQLFLYKNLDLIFATSTAVAHAAIEQQPTLKNRIFVVANPIDTKTFNNIEKPCPNATPNVLYAGRINREKGLDLLVDACRHLAETLPKLRLTLMGEQTTKLGGGGPTYVQELSLRKGNKLELVFSNPVYERKLLAAHMRNCSVFCYPSVAERGESFGVSPLEAMAVGTPVIVSDLACFRDFVCDGENALVFNHRSSDAAQLLSQQLSRVLCDPNLAFTLGAAGARVAKNFGYRPIAIRYLSIMEKAISTKKKIRTA